jgi:acetylornithine aminotransferase/acetylornithine/N-succinyldiaminopimelate aminotransferase
MKSEPITNFEDIVSREDRFQLATYKKMQVAVERGRGAWIFSSDGSRYLDLYGGHAVAATGHCHPHVVASIQRQAQQLLFYSNLVYSEPRARAAEKLVSISPALLTRAFFCNSGTEANENAMRIARLATGRENIISFTGGFHGRTADSISATFLGKYRELGRPNVPGHLEAEFGNIESVDKLANESVAAIILEPIQSMAGVKLATPDFFKGLRNLADSRGIILIYDEVQTGIGRTGEWFFSGSEAGGSVVPDIITLAKSLGSGVPVGACLVREVLGSKIKENELGTTFGGGMLAMAAVTATIEAIEDDRMLENVGTMESDLRRQLENVPGIREIRGRGFLLGIELQEKAAVVHQALLDRRIITGTSSDPHVLRLLPPYCLNSDEVELFTGELKRILRGSMTTEIQGQREGI